MENKENVQKLVFAAKHGNENSFAYLYKLYYEKVYALALTTLKNADDAQDALQQTFMLAWQNLGKLEDDSAFNTWVQRIAVHQCYNILKKKKNHITLEREDEVSDIEDAEQDIALPQQYAERADLNERLKQIIDNLSDVQRQTVMLFYFSELSVGEIAQVMECSEGTVKSRLFLARKAIKTEIEEQERKSGERFYGMAGIPMLPFAGIFTAQVKSTMISQGAAAGIVQGIISGAAGASIGAVPVAPTAASAASTAAKTAPHLQPGAGMKTAALQQSAKTAAKTSAALSKKVIAIVTAVAVGVGGTVGGIMYARYRKNQAPQQNDSVVQEEAEHTDTRLRDASLGDKEESLKEFLANYQWSALGCYDNEDESTLSYEKENNIERNFISSFIGPGGGVNFSLYPVSSPRDLSDSEQEDVINRLGLGDKHISELKAYAKKDIYWIAENIFNIKTAAIDTLLNDLEKKTDTNVFCDGDTYYVSFGGIGGYDFIPDITWVKTDGKKYYLLYDVYTDLNTDGGILKYDELSSSNDVLKDSFYAVMELKEIEGKEYWSMYKNTKVIPKDIFSEDAPSLFRDVSGAYTRAGFGSWHTTVNLESDGSFTGEYQDIDAGIKVILYSEFSGAFTKPVKVDKYTYKMQLKELKYNGKIGEKSFDEQQQMTKKFTDAAFMSEGKNFTLYLKGTPVSKLPEVAQHSISRSGVHTETGLTGNLLYNEEEQAGFLMRTNDRQ